MFAKRVMCLRRSCYWLPLSLIACLSLAGNAQTSASALQITKIDPPNWWANMPKPMLLIQGTGFSDATFSLSDKALRVESVAVSENGHWAQLWLSASPSEMETVTLRVTRRGEHAEAPYVFASRPAASGRYAGFSSRDVMYLIMTDRFADGDKFNDGPSATDAIGSPAATTERAKPRGWHGGDLRGIRQHLDYLQQMGVTTIWPTPVYQNRHEPESYHGYGATDLFAVDEHYGTLNDLKGLAEALHARGMKLVLDTVPNHVGPAHPWIRDEPAADWFHGTTEHHREAESNFRALIDPHAPERDRIGTLEGWFANALPDMNTESPAVAQYLRQDAVWWIEETGADGLRIDTFPYVDREFWHAFNGELKELYPHLTEVGETFNGDPVIVSSFAGGVTRAGVDTELYTPFDFPMYYGLRDVLTKDAPLSKLAEILAADSLYPHPERLVSFLGNHDTTRIVTAMTADEARSEALVQFGFAYIFTTRGMPQIYSGDEIAMQGGEDPDDRHDFPGGFQDGTGAFAVHSRTAKQKRMFAWVSQLVAIRRQHEALACGAEQVLDSNNEWIVFLRDASHASSGTCGASKERVLVVLHRGLKDGEISKLDVNLGQTWMNSCNLAVPDLAAKGSSASVANNVLHVELGTDDALIASCQ
jgi:glycosidase